MSIISGVLMSKQIDVEVKKRTGGTYKGYRLVYQTQEGEIKTLEKAMASLTYTPTVEKQLSELVVGEGFTASLEKNDKGFLDVKSFGAGEFAPDEPVPQANNVTNPIKASGATPYKSANTYETPEERLIRRTFEAQKQKLIVRQATLNSAIGLAGLLGTAESASLEAVLKVAKGLEAYIYDGVEINV